MIQNTTTKWLAPKCLTVIDESFKLLSTAFVANCYWQCTRLATGVCLTINFGISAKTPEIFFCASEISCKFLSIPVSRLLSSMRLNSLRIMLPVGLPPN